MTAPTRRERAAALLTDAEIDGILDAHAVDTGEDTEADAYRKGHEDGFAGLDTGLTYDNDPDSPRSEAYDRGRTAGEALREMDAARAAEGGKA